MQSPSDLFRYPGVELGCRVLFLAAHDLDLSNRQHFAKFARQAYSELCCLPDRSLRTLAEFWGAERPRKSHEVAQSVLLAWAAVVPQGRESRVKNDHTMVRDTTIPAYSQW